MGKRQRSREEKRGRTRLEGEEKGWRGIACVSSTQTAHTHQGKGGNGAKNACERREDRSLKHSLSSLSPAHLHSTFLLPRTSPSIPHHHTPITQLSVSIASRLPNSKHAKWRDTYKPRGAAVSFTCCMSQLRKCSYMHILNTFRVSTGFHLPEICYYCP